MTLRHTRIAVLSTYPPTACGLATFASALVKGLHKIGAKDVSVIDVSTGSAPSLDASIVSSLVPGSHESMDEVVNILNTFDVVMLQHEYGIFGGDDGSEVVDLMRRVDTPFITTLHTVPLAPTTSQKSILEEVVRRSAFSITMTATARQRLLDLYDVNASRVVTIPHGATTPHLVVPAPALAPQLLTWGLLGPGKGIEFVIDALALIKDTHPNVKYVVAGRTHPKVAATQGERYRNSLQQRVFDHGLDSNVYFDSEYRSLDSLLSLIAKSTCVVLPYESTDQITSGVLVDAIAAGRPVIATWFPHAVELLSAGAGIVVPPRNPEAMAEAIKHVISSPETTLEMSRCASDLAPQHDWATVARQYRQLAQHLQVKKVLETR